MGPENAAMGVASGVASVPAAAGIFRGFDSRRLHAGQSEGDLLGGEQRLGDRPQVSVRQALRTDQFRFPAALDLLPLGSASVSDLELTAASRTERAGPPRDLVPGHDLS